MFVPHPLSRLLSWLGVAAHMPRRTLRSPAARAADIWWALLLIVCAEDLAFYLGGYLMYARHPFDLITLH
jgi:hypothetical protein